MQYFPIFMAAKHLNSPGSHAIKNLLSGTFYALSKTVGFQSD
jgi:hypothetical protein